MANEMKEVSTQTLQKRVKAATLILVICWGAIMASVVVTLALGKSPLTTGFFTGVFGLAVASFGIGIGMKTAKEEIARRRGEG